MLTLAVASISPSRWIAPIVWAVVFLAFGWSMAAADIKPGDAFSVPPGYPNNDKGMYPAFGGL
jgi:hypothetical protein